jgi:hypothetical protein
MFRPNDHLQAHRIEETQSLLVRTAEGQHQPSDDTDGDNFKLRSFAGRSALCWVVDAELVRNSSEEMEEFAGVGTHVEFPQIPEGQVWLADDLDEAEYPFAVADGEAQLAAAARGEDQEQAVNAGWIAARHERAKYEPPEYQHANADACKIKPVGTFYDERGELVTCWLIDGRILRDSLQCDFSEGTNGGAESFCPINEIWLEASLSPTELDCILLHERLERSLLLYEHMDYATAHRHAAAVEFQHRRAAGVVPKSMPRVMYFTKGSYFATCPRDERGHCLPRNEADRTGRGLDQGRGQTASPEQRHQQQPPKPKPRPVTKYVSRLSRFVNRARRNRVIHGLRNEAALSEAVGGYNLPDSEPADVLLVYDFRAGEFLDLSGKGMTGFPAHREFLAVREHAVRTLRDGDERQQAWAREALGQHAVFFVECKTLITSKTGKIIMSGKATKRKETWEKRYGGEFWTAAFDDRKGHKYSGNRLYFKLGVGSAKVTEMKPAKDFGELVNAIGGGES